MKKIALLVGARPNYMKIAPIWQVMKRKCDDLVPLVIHTGQHYDREMSDVFFSDLAMPEPDVCLRVGSGSHAEQTAKVMMALEPVLAGMKPGMLVVVGDVNSTLAGALVAVKMGLHVAHVEAGLRSFDRTMPEEINRVLVDSISDTLFTPSRDGNENLRKEGVAGNIHFVGNVMIDSLVQILPRIRSSDVLQRMQVEAGRYVCVTLHRPANVDDERVLREILAGLDEVSRAVPVVFPMHPRTRKVVERIGWVPGGDLRVADPLGYVDFMQLMTSSAVVITDSGGVQEETTYIGIPCLTVRPNTERPVTVTQGTNRLIRAERADIVREVRDALGRIGKAAPQIELWDGRAAERIVEVIRGTAR